MTAEQFLSEKLRRFSLLDISLVKAVYFLFGLLIFVLYPALESLDWWFYGLLGLAAAFPLWLHFFTFEGSYFDKGRAYLKSNSPALQVLLFMTQMFFALMLACLIPWLVSGEWWLYLVLIFVLAIKPMTTTVFW